MGLSVLIVDDYEGTAYLLSRAFSLCGHECNYCLSSRQALLALENKRYDYVILDILINGDSKNGIALHDIISVKYPETKTVFITGVDEDSSLVAEAEKRAPVVFKQFTLKDFVNDIASGKLEKPKQELIEA